MDENIGGQQKIIYRHNAERLLPGRFAILSGTFCHPSYIVKGGAGLTESLFSVDHGLGKILEYNKEKDNNTGSGVILYRMKNGLKAKYFLSRNEVSGATNGIINDYFELMSKKNILTPAIKLSPIINMKFS
jgi:RNA-splicing ligase RtcB